jgi:hypothetical protein
VTIPIHYLIAVYMVVINRNGHNASLALDSAHGYSGG